MIALGIVTVVLVVAVAHAHDRIDTLEARVRAVEQRTANPFI